MAPKARSKARAFKSPTTSNIPSANSSLDPPKPFRRAPKTLEPFLSKLRKNYVYILHIDSQRRDFKQKIFAVPVLMNICIIGLILWRASVIGPYYMKICFSLMGKHNETTIDTLRLPLQEVAAEIFRRAMKFMVDLLIYIFLWPWPRDFFAGWTIGNPIAWRFAVGFRDKEIIVRRSRKWVRNIRDFLNEDGPEQRLLFEKVGSAVDPMWMNEKTGYLMLNNDWDLDWRSIVIATKLVDKKTLSLEDFLTTVLICHKEFGWLVLETGAAAGSAKEEEGRRKIVAFKDELTSMGKENLFFKWIELIQYESSRPEGFGPDQQAAAMVKARALFEAQGVDFDAFWKKVGGMQNMPGMDQL